MQLVVCFVLLVTSAWTAQAFMQRSFLHRPQIAIKSPKDLSLNDIKYELEEEESVDDALRYFKQACSQSGHLQTLRNKDQFENPTEKRKRKKEQARFLERIERNNDRYENNYSNTNTAYNFDKK